MSGVLEDLSRQMSSPWLNKLMSIIVNKYIIKILIIFTIFFLDRISKIYILDFFDKNQIEEIAIFLLVF